jgi:hypothetical protein
MVSRNDYNKTAVSVASLGRPELKRRIRAFKGSFRLDFTDNYLDGLPVEKLRHILLAALLNRR